MVSVHTQKVHTILGMSYGGRGLGGGKQSQYTVYAVSVSTRQPISELENSHLPLQKDDFCCWSRCQICRDVFFFPSNSLRDRTINCLRGNRAWEIEACQSVTVGIFCHSRHEHQSFSVCNGEDTWLPDTAVVRKTCWVSSQSAQFSEWLLSEITMLLLWTTPV